MDAITVLQTHIDQFASRLCSAIGILHQSAPPRPFTPGTDTITTHEDGTDVEIDIMGDGSTLTADRSKREKSDRKEGTDGGIGDLDETCGAIVRDLVASVRGMKEGVEDVCALMLHPTSDESELAGEKENGGPASVATEEEAFKDAMVLLEDRIREVQSELDREWETWCNKCA